MKSLITEKIRTPKGKENGNSKLLFLLQLIDQLTLVRLKHAAALFNSFSATCSMHFLVSLSDSSELQADLQIQYQI